MNNEAWQLFLRFDYFVILLLITGLYCVIVTRNLMRALIGLEILTKAVTLLLIVAGYTTGRVAQAQAFEAGEKVSGVTIHFVDEGLDSGPIICQEPVDISDCRSADEVSRKILKVEHRAYAKVIDSFSKGKYVVEGKTVKYLIKK